MNYFRQNSCSFTYPVVTMGTFDGVHLGHVELLSRLRERADEVSGEAVVITYYHHPLETIHRETFPYLLTERDKKEELLRKYGVDCVLYLNFTREFAAMTPDRFFKKIILDEVGSREIIIGYDTHFGKDRAGDTDFLKKSAEKNNLYLEIIPPVRIQNRIISSSMIRDLIREGAVEKVRTFLGRHYSLVGKVVKGHRIGHDLGYPTVNIYPIDANKLIPSIGVYICWIIIDSIIYQSVTNIGYSPTLKKTGIMEVETHILDFQSDIYGEEVEIIFLRKIREELIFPDRAALIEAIGADIHTAREYFSQNKENQK